VKPLRGRLTALVAFVDSVCGWPSLRLLQVLRRKTGKSNYYFACWAWRGFFGGLASMMIIANVIDTTLDDQPSLRIITGLTAIMLYFAYKEIMKEIGVMEQEQQRADNVVSIAAARRTAPRGLRIWSFIMGSGAAIVGIQLPFCWAVAIAFWSLSTAYYYMYVPPRGKRKRLRLKLPLLSRPSPQPN
jgi:hypothetical protein